MKALTIRQPWASLPAPDDHARPTQPRCLP